ncbi:Zn-dependent hydrolase glyoxalase II family protein [Parvularcula lutaonensis]|nr:Zn-dependent hydrolase glyoxalase II family protein [Parvularcula lutaonensis]
MRMTQEPPFQVQIVPVTPFQQNCSIIRAANGDAAVIDPGGEVDRIEEAAKAMDATIKKIWLTHGHLDHASGAMELKRRTGAPIEGAHEEEVFWLSQIAEQSKRFGIGNEGENVVPDRWLDDGDTVEIGGVVFDVYFTPGHTPGHVIFHQKDARLAFVGDVLFKGSIGRTDFPRGDHATLIRSITEKLWPLGNDTRFVPGHGPLSTFGEERRSNAFVADHVLAGG